MLFFDTPLRESRLGKIFPMEERQDEKSFLYKGNKKKPSGLLVENKKSQSAGWPYLINWLRI